MNLLAEIDSELSAYGHGRPLSKEKALELSAACRGAVKNLAAAIIENMLYARCSLCHGQPAHRGRCQCCHGIELIPEGLTVPQMIVMVEREREMSRELKELRHACLAAIGFVNGGSILNKEQIQRTLADAVRDFATGRKTGA